MKLWSRCQVRVLGPHKAPREACPVSKPLAGIRPGGWTRGCTLRDGASDVMLLLEVGAVLLRDGAAHESWEEQG